MLVEKEKKKTRKETKKRKKTDGDGRILMGDIPLVPSLKATGTKGSINTG
jgi:hypothetical protein